MKHMSRANIYQASNYNVTFDPKTTTAVSYQWWTFVKVIGGEVVFNAYRYSNSTSKHQSKVRSLMQQLGVKIDRTVQVREGLQGITTKRALLKAHKATCQMLAEREEAKRIARNKRAAQRRAERKAALEPNAAGLMRTSGLVAMDGAQ